VAHEIVLVCRCYLYDFASRNPKRGVPRSLFLGVEFVKWTLCYLWFGGLDSPHLPSKVLVRGKNVAVFWRDEVIRFKVSKDTKARLRYYAPFAQASGIHRIDLRGIYGRASKIDGQKDVHVALAHGWLQLHYVSPVAVRKHREECVKFEQWMREWRLAEFDSTVPSENLRLVQSWMVGDRENHPGEERVRAEGP
jgi:hypothetical protein